MNEQGRLAAYWERIKTVPGLGRDVTALAVLMVLGVVAAAIIKSYLGGTTPWSDSTLVKAEFAEVPGLNPSAQTSVTMAGVRVGKVTTAKASDDGSAVVTMKLEGEYDVYRDARAVLRPNNPLNEMQVEIKTSVYHPTNEVDEHDLSKTNLGCSSTWIKSDGDDGNLPPWHYLPPAVDGVLINTTQTTSEMGAYPNDDGHNCLADLVYQAKDGWGTLRNMLGIPGAWSEPCS